MPRVSVVLSTYNNAPYLASAIDSLLSQTYSDLELIVIDDASTDDTPQILEQFRDPRLVRLHNEHNLGLTRSLNLGLKIAQGEFIARMDGDDMAVPASRIADQVAFMDRYPEIGFLSGDMVSIDAQGQLHHNGARFYGYPATHGYLAWHLLWGNPISHITVLMRQSVLHTHQLAYDPAYNMAEDYDMWARLAHVTRLERAETVWAKRRILSTSISHQYTSQQYPLMYAISQREITQLLGMAPAQDALLTLFDMIHRPANAHHAYVAACDVLLEIYQVYRERSLTVVEQERVRGDVVKYLLRLSHRARGHGYREAIYPLLCLRRVSSKEFFSRNAFRYAVQAFYTQPLLR